MNGPLTAKSPPLKAQTLYMHKIQLNKKGDRHQESNREKIKSTILILLKTSISKGESDGSKLTTLITPLAYYPLLSDKG